MAGTPRRKFDYDRQMDQNGVTPPRVTVLPRNCTRCGGMVCRDYDDEGTCLYCGEHFYVAKAKDHDVIELAKEEIHTRARYSSYPYINQTWELGDGGFEL